MHRIGKTLEALSPQSKVWVAIGADALLLPLCMLLAMTLRLSSLEAALQASPWLQITLALLTLPILGLAGLYRAVVRYIDLRVLAAAGGALGAVVLAVYGAALWFEIQWLPRSVLWIYWFVAFAYVVSSRFMARSLLRQGQGSDRPRTRMAIYGAGDAGAQLAQAMQFSQEYQAVCFFDDRAALQRKTVAGLPVYAPMALTPAIKRYEVDEIVVAIPSASMAHKRRLIRRVEGAGLPVKILPGLVDLVNNPQAVAELREVDVADLLGRDPVPANPDLFARNIAGKVVLVTGAGGSIGSELCRQIMSQTPKQLILLDHSEFALYSIDQELRALGKPVEITPCLGSVLDAQLVRGILVGQQVHTVYHAAAYKHVPLVESNMAQGIRNNVKGSLTIATLAAEAKVQTCILVSTDKAVRPTNAMGASKRVAELVFQAAALRHSETVFSMVRFGNVLGSSGSVVPLFHKQIKGGGPITITHPDIIRYFMLIPEAAQLVIQASAMARGGDVFVLDMGEPVRIADLARSMIRLSGLTEKTPSQPDGDIEVKFVGLRPGEKLYEELLIGNNVAPSSHPRIMCARERHIDPLLLEKMLESLFNACDQNDVVAIVRKIQNLVPEYRSAEEVNAEMEAIMQSRPGGFDISGLGDSSALASNAG